MPQAKPARIERNDKEFEKETHKEASEELVEFWRESDGNMPFAEMAERGSWSRTMYSNMWRKYFRAAEGNAKSSSTSMETRVDAGDIIPGDIDDELKIPNDPVMAFVKGYHFGQQERSIEH